MAEVSAEIVASLDEPQPFKVVLTVAGEVVSAQPVASLRAAQELLAALEPLLEGFVAPNA